MPFGMRQTFRIGRTLLVAVLATCSAQWSTAPVAADGDTSTAHALSGEHKNVVMMVMDDARPELRLAYGQQFMVTPNADRLAREGVVFAHAYTQLAVCSPSRNSFLSGRRPDTTKVWNFLTSFRDAPGGADWLSLPQYFKVHGYTTLGAGKLFHTDCAPWNKSANRGGWSCDVCRWDRGPGNCDQPPNLDQPYSWSQDRPYEHPCQELCPQDGPLWPARIAACGDNSSFEAFNDFNSTQAAVGNLRFAARKRNDTGTPFAIMLGVFKPHYPWHVPQQFVDLYRDVQLPPPQHPAIPTGMPEIAYDLGLDGARSLTLLRSQDLNGSTAENVELSNATSPLMTRWAYDNIRKGYYSALSWSDHLLGMLLDALDEVGMKHNTLFVLTADHGYHLGELAQWSKHTVFEHATHVPLIIRAPWITSSVGRCASNTFAELVDLYPTMASLANLPPPPQVEGTDLSPAIREPSLDGLKAAAYSQYPRCPKNLSIPFGLNYCESVPAEHFYAMGLSVRTIDARYTEWRRWDGEALRPRWASTNASDDALIGVELYLHKGDTGRGIGLFDRFELVNVAGVKVHAQLEARHRQLLRAQFGPQSHPA